MVILKQDLQEFAKRTSHIKSNGIMPILGYLLFDNNTITKTNLQYYAKHTVLNHMCDEPILIDEQVLLALANNTNESEITVSKEGSTIHLIAGKRKQTFTTEPVIDFPKFPEHGEGEKVNIPKSVLQSLGIASKFSDTKLTNFRYVYSSENDVFATDNFCMYFKQFDSPIPNIMLTDGACSLVSMYEEAAHYTNGNIDFFECGNTTYGFVRSDCQPANYYQLIKRFSKTNGIKLDKELIQQFCNGVIALSGDVECVCRIEDSENGIVLTYNNEGTNKKDRLPIECEKAEPIRSFAFDARVMLNALSTPYDYIWLSITQGRAILYNEDDPGYMGFVGEKI